MLLTSTITYCFRNLSSTQSSCTTFSAVLRTLFLFHLSFLLFNFYYNILNSITLFTLLSSILLSSFQIVFHTSITPLFLSVIYSSLPVPWPPSKFYLKFLFSSNKFHYLSCARFYRKGFISQKIRGTYEHLYNLIRYNIILFSFVNKVIVWPCDNL